ncbi:glycosyltransferase family 2 protein [Candidatus Microgenomates bacterium]|nr:glycosyltransferase family 2 protein [Candidatus Microgenomates bacterium]
MATKPQVSVVLIAYNEEKYLPQALASIKRQTFQDIEIIVVDNNSTDKTAAIAKKLGAKVIPESIQGMTPARETGFAAACAPIIVKIDADTVLDSRWIEIALKFFTSHPTAVGIRGSFSLKKSTKLGQFFFKNITQPGYYWQARLLAGHHVLTGPVYAIRKSAWEKIRVHRNDRLVHEDIDLTCHLCEFGTIHRHPKLVSYWSDRRLKQPPQKVIFDFYDYYRRFFQTVFLHHPRLRRHQSHFGMAH